MQNSVRLQNSEYPDHLSNVVAESLPAPSISLDDIHQPRVARRSRLETGFIRQPNNEPSTRNSSRQSDFHSSLIGALPGSIPSAMASPLQSPLQSPRLSPRQSFILPTIESSTPSELTESKFNHAYVCESSGSSSPVIRPSSSRRFLGRIRRRNTSKYIYIYIFLNFLPTIV